MQFVARARINASADEVFRWHAEPGALERLTPPWERLTIEQAAPGIRNGDRGILRVRIGPFRVRWLFEHRNYLEGRQFQDVQLSGPFRKWEHTHRFIPDGEHACFVEDRIDYSLPLGALGDFVAGWFVQSKLKRLFGYRHKITEDAANSFKEA